MRPISVHRNFFFTPLLIVLYLIACSPQKPKSKQDPEIKIREATEPSSINPFFVQDELGFYICSQIWQPLLAIDYEKEELVGVLAKSRPKISSSDIWKMKIHYQLRKEATFADGKAVNYSDILFSLKANISPLVNPYYSAYYEFIDSISVDCPDSSCFTVYSRDAYYLSEFSSGDYFIVSEAQFDPNEVLRNYSISELKLLSENIADSVLTEYSSQIQAMDFRDSTPTLGSAPYMLNQWTSGEKLRLVKQSEWWGDQFEGLNTYFNAKAQQFSFYFVEDASTAVNALENGDFDIMRSIPPKQFRRLEKDSSFSKAYKLSSTPRFAYQYLGFNLKNKLLKSLNLRKAIAFSLPTAKIIDKLYYGLASPCRSIQTKAGTPAGDLPSRYTNNLDSAKAYFNAFRSENPNADLKLTYTYNAGNDKRKAIGLILKESLKTIGIELNIETYEWTVYLKMLKAGELDLFLNGTVNSAMTPDLSNSFHSNAMMAGRNYFNYQDQRSDQLLDSIQHCLEAQKRNRLFVKLENRIFEQLPMLPLIQPMENIAFSRRLQNAKAYRLRPNFWVAEISIK